MLKIQAVELEPCKWPWNCKAPQPPSPRCVCIYLYWFERHTNLSVANGYYKSSGKEGMKTQRPIYPKLCSRMWSDQKDRDRERDRDSQYKTPCCVVRNTYGRSYKYSCHISHTEKADILEMIGASEPIKRWVWKGLSRSWTCFYKHLDTLQFARWVEVALLCCFQFHANQVEFAFLPKTCV